MTSFDKLSPLLQYHIVNTVGWRSLRSLQEASIDPIMRGDHCLLLAPTAGGKTEAAIFPILSRITEQHHEGLSVLYICPLRALLNNLHIRLQEYCAMVGLNCGIWHGDVGPSARNRIKRDQPDILLTTPESLEVMLISKQGEAREMLKGVRVVVIDEIHAFAGDDRGWHLLALLERIGVLAGREVQRIGLSATVGNPEQLLTWMAGHCHGTRCVVNPADNASMTDVDVQLDYVGTITNAALVISRLHRGEKRLVFCDSRSRVEELGVELRRLGVNTYLSHSSLSVEERRTSEEAFALAQDCVIVATSTLELGIDVGDLDRVIQVDAPFMVASFLQRLGRTGRRTGTRRNCLFLATNDAALLRAAALIALWETGFVEPILPPECPLHIFAQQLMALSLQEGGIGVNDWRRWLSRLPVFSDQFSEDLNAVIANLLDRNIIFSDQVRLSFGEEGESLYGRRHFLELISVFTSPPLITVVHGNREIGTVHPIAFVAHRPERPAILSLGGRGWQVESLDWSKKVAHVVPMEGKGKGQWLTSCFGLSYRLSRAIRDVLADDDISTRWSTRAREQISELRNTYGFVDRTNDAVVVASESCQLDWYTFAGNMINQAIAGSLNRCGYEDVKADDFRIQVLSTIDHQKLVEIIKNLTAAGVIETFLVPEEFLDQLKFSECLPKQMAEDIVKSRCLMADQIESVLTGKIVARASPNDRPRAPDG